MTLLLRHREPSTSLTKKSQAFEPDRASDNVLNKPWFENIDVSGFGAGGFVWTGADANRPDGAFLNYESSLFIEGDVWNDLSFYTELQAIRLGDEDTKFTRTGETYVHFKNVLGSIGDDLLGIKLGRMDIPFGEEYLTQDTIDNPLITLTAGYPYGFDEGVVLYGNVSDLGWIFSVMDGSDVRGFDDSGDKAVTAKLYGNVSDNLYLSASVMRNGDAAESAFEFGGSHFQPVGTERESALGESASTQVDAIVYELDARYSFDEKGQILLTWGQAFVDDADSTFDRDLIYFTVEPLYRFSDKLYGVLRFSGVGTFDEDEGYHFDGKPFTDGNDSFGYDAEYLLRGSVGLGYWLNPNAVVKIEYSQDDFPGYQGFPL